MTLSEYEEKRNKNREIAVKHLENGVDFADIDSVFIDETVKIGKGTFIGPCVTLSGDTEIGENCTIHQNTRMVNAKIGDGTTVESSVILDSTVGAETSVGPFAYIRPGSKVGNKCKVGDFVEVKNSTMGDGTKAAHLTYIGDSDLGKNVNLGCGVVFVNYDGREKHRSTVGDGCFIGCNVNLISPVNIEDGAYIAAGSTINRDVPKDSLAVARTKQTVIPGWAARSGMYKRSKDK